MSFFDELKRRNVVRVGVAYIVASWVFLQVADLVFEAINAPDWVLQALLALAVMGFLAAVIIAWAYEVTPEGIKKEKDVQRDESVTHQTAARLDRLTIGLVIAAIAIVAVDRMIPEPGENVSAETSAQTPVQESLPAEKSPLGSDEKSVAVLPFVNMSSDPEQEFFSDGISEEILNVLTRIPNLKVAARTSSFQFKGQNQDVADIARQLKVNHILEGSVRKAGNQLRITAQLIEAESGFHLWSDTYDRQLEDVFAIQDEIAGAIAGELEARLGRQTLLAAQTVNMEAYELYLKGRSLVATRNEIDLMEGIDLLQQAIEISPEYGAAMGTMAKAYMVLPYFSNTVDVGEVREQARTWSENALQIEPDNSDALSALAIVTNESDLDPEAAIALMRHAVETNPGSVSANNFLGDLLIRTGDLEGAMIYESRAAELDPLGTVQLTDLANVYLLLDDYDMVLELCDRALELNPIAFQAVRLQQAVWFAQGDVDNLMAVDQFTGAPRLEAEGIKLHIEVAKGDLDAARSTLENMARRARIGNQSAVSVAFGAMLIPDFDLAAEMLELALERNDGTWAYPYWFRLPEQAPDNEAWQAFWSKPGPARLADLRRKNGLHARTYRFGEAAEQ
jgi:TolB-like protein/Tfp pilus assembly protein PilF